MNENLRFPQLFFIFLFTFEDEKMVHHADNDLDDHKSRAFHTVLANCLLLLWNGRIYIRISIHFRPHGFCNR